MRFTVSVQPGGQAFPVEAGQRVLDAALAAGIVLPYSCRNGTCSTCRGRIVSGHVEAGPAPARILDEDDRARGYTLLCQAQACSDLTIEAQQVHLASDVVVRKMPVRVLSLDPLAPDVMQVVLQLPTAEAFHFHPGQYLDFVFRDGQRRSYSMACPQVENHRISLHLRHMPGGMFTPRVFGAADDPVKPRDILRIEGPLGSFFVREDSDRPIVFLASGTGFAPIRAMIEGMAMRGLARAAVLYWGGRRPADLYQLDVARGWAQQLPQFRFVPVVSDALPQDDWQGRAGWVHHAVMTDLPDLSGHAVYACGAPAMVEAARHDFTRHCGLARDQFYADAFISEADRALAEA